jgi:hypothetical protein
LYAAWFFFSFSLGCRKFFFEIFQPSPPPSKVKWSAPYRDVAKRPLKERRKCFTCLSDIIQVTSVFWLLFGMQNNYVSYQTTNVLWAKQKVLIEKFRGRNAIESLSFAFIRQTPLARQWQILRYQAIKSKWTWCFYGKLQCIIILST